MNANESVAAADPAVERALVRDRRLIRWLTGVTIALWVVVLAAVGYLLFTYFLLVVPRIDVMLRAEPTAGSKLESWNATLAVALAWGVAIVVGMVGLLTLAAMTSVGLMFASRRATLRQINLSLVQISHQLRDLQTTRPKE